MSTNSNLTPDENAKLQPIRVVLADDVNTQAGIKKNCLRR